ncbi:hypothetical protein M8818_004397 [Zalaria obscura]|uniref:Uncharacterized protein n=1 Tax=Zalaria obscura TaxID=2024903 RepID=A0ACC3SBW3_9PEZI
MNQVVDYPSQFNPFQQQQHQQQQPAPLHSAQAHFFPNGPSPAAGQAFPHPPYPGGRFPTPAQQHGATPAGFGIGTGALPPHSGGMMMPGHHNPYTSAPYSQSIAAPSVTATPVQRAVTHSATPPLQVSPNVNLAQRLQQAQAQASQQPSMPAPSPARPNSGHATSANLSPQPASPGASQAREKERLALLLDINVELLQEINKLQAQGQGGAMNPQQAALYKANGQSDKMASDLYIHQTDMHQKKPGQPPAHPPSFIYPPPNMPSLQEKYAALRKLFPGWQGRDGPQQQQQSPQHMGMGGQNASSHAPNPVMA